MTITIRPDRAGATVITDNPEEAAAVLIELQAQEYELGKVRMMGFLGQGSDDHGVQEGGPVEDIDDQPKPRGQKWTSEEESVLKRGIRSGLNCRQVGDRLGRSASSVNNKLLAMEKERAALNLAPIRPVVKS